ncbi:hypothetical protein CTAYLR_003847 [Chrysophaeum taylorii]|uniref:Uncharacterized protein n=1 Tax=Chrysophaeum taylorii TaxID=2483200 RepID=A0AAD7UDH9_9STRA|nr:hypothetical protein CTAYLR_003847 [Chrysophaeum taylorii]
MLVRAIIVVGCACGFVVVPQARAKAVRTSPSLVVREASTNYVAPQDYRLSVWLTALGLGLDQVPYAQYSIGPFLTIAGLLFLLQTVRLRFVCDKDSFRILQTSSFKEALISSGENVIIGGENTWKLKSLVNYDTFPKGWIDLPWGPVLIYFKETQTPKSSWTWGIGKGANSPEAIKKGARPGQVHFFPAICDAKSLFAEFEKRGIKQIK